MRKITDEEFYEKFTPIENHIDDNAGWDGCMFETYGDESDFVAEQDNNNVWTIIEGDDDDIFIESGYHFVNRMGYLITKEKWVEDTLVKTDF